MSASQRQLRQFLRGVRLTWCLSAALAGIVAVAGVLAACVLLAVVLDNLFVLPPTARWVCLAAGAVLGSAALWFGLLARMPLRARDERLAAYRQAVLQAVREVEDALALEHHQAELLAALDRQLEAARRSRRQSDARYRQGAESYLSVLSALVSVQRIERQLADASLDRMAYRVRLCRALAGGWETGADRADDKETTSR